MHFFKSNSPATMSTSKRSSSVSSASSTSSSYYEIRSSSNKKHGTAWYTFDKTSSKSHNEDEARLSAAMAKSKCDSFLQITLSDHAASLTKLFNTQTCTEMPSACVSRHFDISATIYVKNQSSAHCSCHSTAFDLRPFSRVPSAFLTPILDKFML
ncbi:hypothetical protein MN608_01666 [Microdochium nivale]|nr:hypothetical protein MN608_01666 [Microdochium nivale]